MQLMALPKKILRCGELSLDLSVPHVMGILNVTPDSFSDGGKHNGKAQAIAHAMVKALMEWETIDREQIRDIMEGREPQPPKVYVAENPVIDVTPTDGPSTPPPLPSAT